MRPDAANKVSDLRACIESFLTHDHRRQLVVREREQERARPESGVLKQSTKLILRIGGRLPGSIAILDADARDSKVILVEPVEILEAEPVLDSDGEMTFRSEPSADGQEQICCRTRPREEHRCVLEHADQEDPVVATLRLEGENVVVEDSHVREVTRPGGGDSCPTPRPFHRIDVSATLAQIPRYRSRSGTEFKNALPSRYLQWSHEEVSLSRQVILRRPIDERRLQFLRERTQVGRMSNSPQDALLFFVTVGIGEIG